MSQRLVGAVKEEYLITPEVLLKWKRAFFDPIMVSYTNAHFKYDKIKNILINSAWYVIQKSDDYNPMHNHSEYVKGNYTLSCVGYLELPESMKSTDNAKAHNDFSGQIEFLKDLKICFPIADIESIQRFANGFCFLII